MLDTLYRNSHIEDIYNNRKKLEMMIEKEYSFIANHTIYNPNEVISVYCDPIEPSCFSGDYRLEEAYPDTITLIDRRTHGEIPQVITEEYTAGIIAAAIKRYSTMTADDVDKLILRAIARNSDSYNFDPTAAADDIYKTITADTDEDDSNTNIDTVTLWLADLIMTRKDRYHFDPKTIRFAEQYTTGRTIVPYASTEDIALIANIWLPYF